MSPILPLSFPRTSRHATTGRQKWHSSAMYRSRHTDTPQGRYNRMNGRLWSFIPNTHLLPILKFPYNPLSLCQAYLSTMPKLTFLVFWHMCVIIKLYITFRHRDWHTPPYPRPDTDHIRNGYYSTRRTACICRISYIGRFIKRQVYIILFMRTIL